MPESKYCRCGRRYTAPGQDVCDLCKWGQQKAIDLYIELQNRAIAAERKITELEVKLVNLANTAQHWHSTHGARFGCTPDPTKDELTRWKRWKEDGDLIASYLKEKEDDQAKDASGESTRGQQNQS